MKSYFLAIALLLIAVGVSAEEGFKYDAKGKRDPFIPLVSREGIYASDAYGIKGINDVRLEGILWDETKGSMAIINGEIVTKGEVLGPLEVLRIEKDGVVFNLDGEEVMVELIDGERYF